MGFAAFRIVTMFEEGRTKHVKKGYKRVFHSVSNVAAFLYSLGEPTWLFESFRGMDGMDELRGKRESADGKRAFLSYHNGRRGCRL